MSGLGDGIALVWPVRVRSAAGQPVMLGDIGFIRADLFERICRIINLDAIERQARRAHLVQQRRSIEREAALAPAWMRDDSHPAVGVHGVDSLGEWRCDA